MTTTELVDRYLKRILQSARDGQSGKNLHTACDEVSSALNGVMDTFPALGDRPTSEGLTELLQQLQCEPHGNHTVYGHVISFAIRGVTEKLSYFK